MADDIVDRLKRWKSAKFGESPNNWGEDLKSDLADAIMVIDGLRDETRRLMRSYSESLGRESKI